VNKAASQGLFTAMLPTWGDKWNGRGTGPRVFTPENARSFGLFLGRRYQGQPIIWVLGGDRAIETYEHADIIRAMVAGLKEGDDGQHLMTFHPCGQQTSSAYFQCDRWLDFNMCQTGHRIDRDNYRTVADDYARTPVKPCLDGEPGYEDHPSGFKPENGWIDQHDCRKFLYWGLFAGACGHTYGCHDIWQFWQPGRVPKTHARTPWQQALLLPGAAQMQYGRKLIESGPFFDRVPDQSLLATNSDAPGGHIQVCRGENKSYALAYLPLGGRISLRISGLADTAWRARWFDPRTGEWTLIGPVTSAECTFTAPSGERGQDWVLVLTAQQC
jgi:hypothetical protein